MGTVKCERCGGHAEADSIEKGAPLIDHAVGLARGRPCGPDRAELVMVGETAPTPKVETPKATKTSEKEAS